jgi:cardiolipin synthase
MRLNRLRGAIALSSLLTLAGCGLTHPLAQAGNPSLQATDLGPNDSPRLVVHVPPHPLSAPQPWQGNNSATLHVGPADNVAAIKDVITHAKKTLFIEVFDFADDSMGQQITPLVCDAAKRGVRVKFLCDWVASKFKGGGKLGQQITAAGGEFHMWEPRFVVQSDGRKGINITHRKVYLADGERGLTGGVNLAAPFDTTTHDLLVDFHGDEAEQLHTEFARDWKNGGGGDLAWDPLPAGVTYGTVQAQTIVTSPVEGRFEAQTDIYRHLDAAQREIVVENQYLWDQGITDRLLAAAKRGVSVRVIVPGKSNTKAFHFLRGQALNELLQAGGQTRLYNGVPETAHMHTKYFSVDDQWAAFGSVNGDTRALIDNQELDVATTDSGLIGQLKTRLFENDWQNASVAYHFDDSSFFDGPFKYIWQVLDYYM